MHLFLNCDAKVMLIFGTAKCLCVFFNKSCIFLFLGVGKARSFVSLGAEIIPYSCLIAFCSFGRRTAFLGVSEEFRAGTLPVHFSGFAFSSAVLTEHREQAYMRSLARTLRDSRTSRRMRL